MFPISGWKKPIIAALLVALAIGGCSRNTPSATGGDKLPKSETYYTFETVVTVKVYDKNVTEANFAAVKQILDDVELELNRTNKDSEIYRVNQAAGKNPVAVSETTFIAVKDAMEDAVASNGVFDPSVGPLVDLWGVGKEGAKKPADADVKKALALVRYEDVELNEAEHTVFLKRAGMSLDLGGTGKGYAADRIASYLLAQGFNSAIVDMGGNLLTVGLKPDGSEWKIGVQDPDQKRGASVGTLTIDGKAVVASGIYERYFMENGVRYHHIMDTDTGYPADNELASVTIVTDNAMKGEGLDNWVFCLGLDKGMKYIESREDAEAIFVTKDNKVYLSSGLKGKLAMSSEHFTLVEK